MHSLCHLPWFCGQDIWIDLFSAATVLLVAFFSFQYYKLDRKKKDLCLAAAFSIIALAFLFNILTNFAVYTHVLETEKIGTVTVVEHTYMLSPLLSTIGYVAFRFLMLVGIYALFSVKSGNSKAAHILMVFLMFLAVFFSRESYYIFHATALLLLLFIVQQYHSAYKERKNKNTLCLCSSFAVIGVSQVVFIFVQLNPVLYAAASILQLIGYFLLLITLARILYYAKKKNKD
jgi:hypothetical protein